MGNRIQVGPTSRWPIRSSSTWCGPSCAPRRAPARRRDGVRIPARRAQLRPAAEAAVRYGLAQARLRDGRPVAAEREVDDLRRLKVAIAHGRDAGRPGAPEAGRCRGAAAPARRAAALPAGACRSPTAWSKRCWKPRLPHDALKFAEDELLNYPSDAKMHALQAKTYAMLGRRLQQHRAQAEAYALLGQLAAAAEQLELAQKSGDGNFYEYSQVDSRLREIRKRTGRRGQQPNRNRCRT
jgi:predicted Zn-dependent protease